MPVSSTKSTGSKKTREEEVKDQFPVPLPVKIPNGWKPWQNYIMLAMGATSSEYCPCFMRADGLTVILTYQSEQDGKKWIHTSISRKDRVPSYYELCDVKRDFLGDDSLSLMVFVPKSEHVNIHPHCLHLWTCTDGRPTPDFTWGLNSI